MTDAEFKVCSFPTEVFLVLPYDGLKVDIWTLGFLLYGNRGLSVLFAGATLLELREQLQVQNDAPYKLPKELISIHY